MNAERSWWDSLVWYLYVIISYIYIIYTIIYRLYIEIWIISCVNVELESTSCLSSIDKIPKLWRVWWEHPWRIDFWKISFWMIFSSDDFICVLRSPHVIPQQLRVCPFYSPIHLGWMMFLVSSHQLAPWSSVALSKGADRRVSRWHHFSGASSGKNFGFFFKYILPPCRIAIDPFLVGKEDVSSIAYPWSVGWN